jgi:hypothetical protein
MTAYRNKYLEMLKAQKSEKRPGEELTKPTKLGFVSFGSAQVGAFSQNYAPPLNSEGVPYGGCPSCGRGEFWRWPKFHKAHDPNGWICWFCSPPPQGTGPFDFCGIPDAATPPRGICLEVTRHE